jgi:hypothetical protein
VCDKFQLAVDLALLFDIEGDYQGDFFNNLLMVALF